MKRTYPGLWAAALMLWGAAAWADSYTDTAALFKNAGQSASFFHNSYGYAVFPTVGKGGFVVGAAHGSGHVYRHGRYGGRYDGESAERRFSGRRSGVQPDRVFRGQGRF
jgi:hypothetical protein